MHCACYELKLSERQYYNEVHGSDGSSRYRGNSRGEDRGTMMGGGENFPGGKRFQQQEVTEMPSERSVLTLSASSGSDGYGYH